jgi:uncharacterized protein RhaS with RHS repeats
MEIVRNFLRSWPTHGATDSGQLQRHKYTTADNLGSPRVITNSSASVVSRHDYMPFGEELRAASGDALPQ